MKKDNIHISDFAKAILEGTRKAVRKLVEASIKNIHYLPCHTTAYGV